MKSRNNYDIIQIYLEKEAAELKLGIDSSKWKRHFPVPCALVDNYLKLADEAALKVLLCLLNSDEEYLESEYITKKTGLNAHQIEDAVAFWVSQGIMDLPEGFVYNGNSEAKSEPVPVNKVVHSAYRPDDIAKMNQQDAGFKALSAEAETTLGRPLKHYDLETLIIMRDNYGFSDPAIILILEHCAKLDKDKPKYYETVAASMFEKGITEYEQLEAEFNRLDEYHSFEGEIKRAFGISSKLTKKQSEFIENWRNAGHSVELISYAWEKCVNATNKTQFPYIDKVLANWASKNITTVEQAENENSPAANAAKERSYDLGEYDDFTLGNYIKK